jgi:hypothetical protein
MTLTGPGDDVDRPGMTFTGPGDDVDRSGGWR